EAVRDPARRARCFLLAYAAGTGVYDASLALVTTYRDEPAARRKLNEPDPVCDIPAGMFDRIYENVVSDRNAETLAQMSSHYRDRFPRWRADRVLDEQDLDWLARRADVATASIARRSIGFNRTTAQIELLVGRVKGDAYSPVYAAQSMVSSWIGDTRLVQRPPLIRREQIVEMQAQMQPGDILLERRNWFFSNAFLPGFWPHGALYTGTIDDLAKLGIARKDEATGRWTSDDPEVRDRLERFIAHAHDGSPHTVIESVSEGVIFNSLTESMHADYVAVLRPRLGDEQKALAIRRAFLHEGRPYDFEFDFATSDKLVCTELLYRSYQGLLNFELVKIMGRDTLPALEICRKFARERGASGDERELDFVLFLDGRVGENRAFLAGEDEFCESANRPRGFNE
ncbi:MAG: YiiX/YebB-like N1pC/P60 family cysteine hydrolase, partial [Tepidisphaeraceae bacterium]